MADEEYNDVYDDDEDTQKDMYFSFRIGDEEYAIEIGYVNEVIGMMKITEVPEMPDFVRGVINLRGQVVPVTDVRTRFKMEPREYDDRTCVIVVNVQDTAIGMAVDQVSDVLNIPEKDREPPPKVSKNETSRFIKGMGKVDEEVKILLDVNKLLYDGELEQAVAAETV